MKRTVSCAVRSRTPALTSSALSMEANRVSTFSPRCSRPRIAASNPSVDFARTANPSAHAGRHWQMPARSSRRRFGAGDKMLCVERRIAGRDFIQSVCQRGVRRGDTLPAIQGGNWFGGRSQRGLIDDGARHRHDIVITAPCDIAGRALERRALVAGALAKNAAKPQENENGQSQKNDGCKYPRRFTFRSAPRRLIDFRGALSGSTIHPPPWRPPEPGSCRHEIRQRQYGPLAASVRSRRDGHTTGKRTNDGTGLTPFNALIYADSILSAIHGQPFAARSGPSSLSNAAGL